MDVKFSGSATTDVTWVDQWTISMEQPLACQRCIPQYICARFFADMWLQYTAILPNILNIYVYIHLYNIYTIIYMSKLYIIYYIYISISIYENSVFDAVKARILRISGQS